LADVSPVLLEKCESGEISLAILQAFTCYRCFVIDRSPTGSFLGEKDCLVPGHCHCKRAVRYSRFRDSSLIKPSKIVPVAGKAITTPELALLTENVNCGGLFPECAFRTHDARFRRREDDAAYIISGITLDVTLFGWLPG